MSNLQARWGYNLIWVDLEAAHTISAVAGSIIDQCRKYDPSLAPCVLPLDYDVPKPDADNVSGGKTGPTIYDVIDDAVRRVTGALRRSRYFIAFDGLETYIWSPTAHHGNTHTSSKAEEQKKVGHLIKFLGRLSDEKLGESRIALSIDPPRTRTEEDRTAAKLLAKELKKLRRKAAKFLSAAWKCKTCRYDAVFEPDTKTKLMNRKDGLVTVAAGTVSPDIRRSQHALALSVLATFRRTRPLALVYRALRPILGDPEEINPFLEDNQSYGDKEEVALLRQIEGGSVWFPRELRDYIYGHNTLQTSASAMCACLVSNQDCAETVCQLLLNSCTHQMVGRAWYAGAFVPSSDTFGLMEYLYHRLASVRSLTKLIGLVAAPDSARRKDQIQQGIDHFNKIIGQAADPAELASRFESSELKSVFDANPSMTLESLRREFVSRRRKELFRLLRAWRRSENALRAQVPAEQLRRWCRQFLRDDLRYRCDRLVIGYDDHGNPKTLAYDENNEPVAIMYDEEGHPTKVSYQRGMNAGKEESWNASDQTRLSCSLPCLQEPGEEGNRQDALTQLRNYAEEFNARILIDRSDYERCIALHKGDYLGKTEELPAQFQAELDRAATSQPSALVKALEDFERMLTQHPDQPSDELVSAVGQFRKNLDEAASQPTPEVIRMAHRFIEVLRCELRMAQEGTSKAEDLWEQIGIVVNGEVAQKFKGWYEAQTSADSQRENDNTGLYEVELRWLHLLSDYALGQVSVFSHNGFSGMLPHPSGKWNDDWFNKTPADLIHDGNVKARLQSQPATLPRSSIVNAAPDGSLYLQYRGIFLIQQARWHLNDVAANPGLSGNARATAMKASADESLRTLSEARGGLAENNPLILALADMYATEICLAHARVLLHDQADVDPAKPADGFRLAHARYDTARGYLLRARAALLRSQRNVVWWRFFFHLTAQYHTDRLLLALANYIRRPQASAGELWRAAGATAAIVAGTGAMKTANGLVNAAVGVAANCQPTGEAGWKAPDSPGPAQHLLRLQKGYQSLRHTYDLYLPGSQQRMAWLPRKVRELTLAGFAFGLIAWPRPHLYSLKDELPADAKECLKKQLRAMACAAGLNPEDKSKSEYKESGAEKAMDDMYDSIIEVNFSASVVARCAAARVLRQHIINNAAR